MRRMIITLSVFILFGISRSVEAFQFTQDGSFVPRELGFTLRADAPPDKAGRLAQIAAASRLQQIVPGIPIYALTFPAGANLDERLSRILRDTDVVVAGRNSVVVLAQIPNDPFFSQQWNLRNLAQGIDIGAPGAWDEGVGSPQVTVAVVDTGVDVAHPDLSPNIVGGFDVTTGSSVIIDYAANSHGTAISGIIAARGNNGVGVAGVTWNTKIMPVTFCDPSRPPSATNCTELAAAAALAWARQQGAKIINMSANFFEPANNLINELTNGRGAGILYVFSAGNSNNFNVAGLNIDEQQGGNRVPCSSTLDNLICVAAVDRNGAVPLFSNRGQISVDLGAPGVDVFSTVIGGYGLPGPACCNFPNGAGTSYAAPHVTGVAALMKAINGSYDYRRLRENLLLAAQPLPALAGITATGRMVNADVAAHAFGDSFDDGRDRFFFPGGTGARWGVATNASGANCLTRIISVGDPAVGDLTAETTFSGIAGAGGDFTSASLKIAYPQGTFNQSLLIRVATSSGSFSTKQGRIGVGHIYETSKNSQTCVFGTYD